MGISPSTGLGGDTFQRERAQGRSLARRWEGKQGRMWGAQWVTRPGVAAAGSGKMQCPMVRHSCGRCHLKAVLRAEPSLSGLSSLQKPDCARPYVAGENLRLQGEGFQFNFRFFWCLVFLRWKKGPGRCGSQVKH